MLNMKGKKLVAVVMAGGKGERFWPKSRACLPKPFLKLGSQDKTLIQATVQRLVRLVSEENIFIVTGKEYYDIICEQLPDFRTENIIVEPVGRNTAACIGLAAIHIEQRVPDSVMLVVPSDHLVLDEENFVQVLGAAAEMAAQHEYLVTIGIQPTYPETGYGYIKRGTQLDTFSGQRVHYVTKFEEKPDLAKATDYVVSGEYLWNSGIFIWQTQTIRRCIECHLGSLHSGLERIKEFLGTAEEERVILEEYAYFENISIDHGIMEVAESTCVFPGSFGWNDVGTWVSLERVYQPDREGNIVLGNVVEIDAKGCIIDASTKLVALMGVENLVIVDTEDVILVCSKGKVQKIKDLVLKLKELQLYEYL